MLSKVEQAMATSASASPSQPNRLGIIAIVAVIVLASVVVLGFHGSTGGGIQSTQTVNIVNGLITVDAGDYEYYQFTVPPGATNVETHGSFTVSGGSGNDIVVLIMDLIEFFNWQNEHQTGAYYDSDQLTASNFDVLLPSGSGTYCLVYSNTFSIMNQKSVNTEANLTYTS
jgi:hypothetical protein